MDKLWTDYSKCIDLIENNQHNQAVPSLCNILDHLENTEPLNVDAYLATLFLLDDCYQELNNQYLSYELYEKAFILVRKGYL